MLKLLIAAILLAFFSGCRSPLPRKPVDNTQIVYNAKKAVS